MKNTEKVVDTRREQMLHITDIDRVTGDGEIINELCKATVLKRKEAALKWDKRGYVKDGRGAELELV